MKMGDYLVSKINFYEGDKINEGDSRSIYGKRFLNILRTPIFKKGEKYLIKNISEEKFFVGCTSYIYTGTPSSNGSWNNQYGQYYIHKRYNINDTWYEEYEVDTLFYTQSELRKLKLKTLKKLNNFD